jgi:hypothetical protein
MSITSITLWAVALLMAVLGYQREQWWLPAGAAAVSTALVLVLHSAYGGAAPAERVLFAALTLPFHLAAFYAAYGIGRGLARWRMGKP